MKTWATCPTVLRAPIEEYGAHEQPICQSCWLLMASGDVNRMALADSDRARRIITYWIEHYD